MNMRDNYDFSDAVKNPFAGKLKGKYTVTVHYDFTANDNQIEEKEQPESDKLNTKQAQA